MIEAVQKNDRDRIKILLEEKHVDINTRDSHYRTALFFAVENGNLSIVEYLLNKGADINVYDNNGLSIYKLAKNLAKKYPKNLDIKKIFDLIESKKNPDKGLL